MMDIYSIGHGARPLDEFVRTLTAWGISTLADVRSYPSSRKHPHFAAEPLRSALATEGIAYEHLRGLGGRRHSSGASEHTALRSPGFRAYADHMSSTEFGLDYGRLFELATAQPTAFMCAETLWWRCHRRFIADRLTVDGWKVTHLLGPGPGHVHALSPAARVQGWRLVYDRAPAPDDA
jgi:uncharacterized protein (DUF488 family)